MSKSKPVWSKRVGDAGISELNVAYCAGRDVVGKPPADEALIPFDLMTNAAHALMLSQVGILSSDESKAILSALLQVKNDSEQGTQILDPAAEDVHMSIEQRVTELAGEGMGGRLHTGRSRNDQVATDMALWMRETIVSLIQDMIGLLDTLIEHADEYKNTPVPGMTHMQPAMITTWGHWVGGYAVRISRGIDSLFAVLDRLKFCPLGSAASFGSSWPTNREITAQHLGFQEPSLHTTDSIWSRGETEAAFAFAVSQIFSYLSSMGQDLILISTPPRQWVRLANDVTTGSSIMPQKRNPDFAEVTRAKAASVAGMLQTLIGISTAAPAGYNRDTQWTKYLVMDVAEEIRFAPSLFAKVFETLNVKTDEMKKAADIGFLNATDVADFLAQSRMLPFRTCYQVMGKAVADAESIGKLTKEIVNTALAESAPDAKPLTDEEMQQLENADRLVELRHQTGSPSSDKVTELLAKLRTQSTDHQGQCNEMKAHLKIVSEQLWKTVQTKTE